MKVWPFLLGLICGLVILFSINNYAIKKQKDSQLWEETIKQRIEQVQPKHDQLIRKINDSEKLQDMIISINDKMMDLVTLMGSIYPEFREDVLKTFDEVEEKYDHGNLDYSFE